MREQVIESERLQQATGELLYTSRTLNLADAGIAMSGLKNS